MSCVWAIRSSSLPASFIWAIGLQFFCSLLLTFTFGMEVTKPMAQSKGNFQSQTVYGFHQLNYFSLNYKFKFNSFFNIFTFFSLGHLYTISILHGQIYIESITSTRVHNHLVILVSLSIIL